MRCFESSSRGAKTTAPSAYYMRGNWGTKRECASVSMIGLLDGQLHNEHPGAWTDGNASLRIVFARPRYIRWISIAVDSGPITNHLVVCINEGTPLKVSIQGKKVLRFRVKVDSQFSCLTLGIQSQTFTPRSIDKTGSDSCELGVRISEMQFAKYWWRLPLNASRFAFLPKFLFLSESLWRRGQRQAG